MWRRGSGPGLEGPPPDRLGQGGVALAVGDGRRFRRGQRQAAAGAAEPPSKTGTDVVSLA